MARRSSVPGPDHLPEAAPHGKSGRAWLVGPYVVALIAAVAWSGAWVWASRRAAADLDQAAQALRQSGWEVSWRERQVGGYPFRLDLTLVDLSARDPSGLALNLPRLEAEAYMHAPHHWVLAAPRGLTFVRPEGGPVTVSGRMIHASARSLDSRPPAISIEGFGLRFDPAPSARPFSVASAERAQFHLRPGPGGQGAILVKVDGGRATPGTVAGALAGSAPFEFVWDSLVAHADRVSGPSVGPALASWRAAGGRLDVREAHLTTAASGVAAGSGAWLSLAPDGALEGRLPLAAKGQGPSGVLELTSGRIRLGGVDLGPAPRLP